MPQHKIEPEARICEVCGETFFVGGRGRPPRTVRRCSNRCQRAGRIKPGKQARELTLPQAAYLAGMIDGEGSIMVTHKWQVITIRLTCSNTKRVVLDTIAEWTDVGNVNINRPEGPRNATSYVWNANGDSAASVLRQIRPFMLVKPEQADHALWVQSQLRDTARKADRSWMEPAFERMARLNRRGPG
jgi:hypothetical protein